jgi:hypothetical protein
MLREQVEADLVRALDKVPPVNAPGAPPVAITAPAEDEPSYPEEEPGAPVAVAQRPAERPGSVRGLAAGVGVSLLSRTLHFDVASAPGYAGGTLAAIRADGAVFPLAMSKELAEEHPVLASFGLTGSYEHVLSFSSTTASGRSEGNASRWSVLFVGRIPLGHEAVGGVLTIDTGYQSLSFASRSVLDVGVPDVSYDLVDAGLGWERALGTRVVVLALRAAYLGVVGAGTIASTTEYGPLHGSGFEGTLDLSVWPTRWLWLRLEARYTPLSLSFATAGTRFAHSAVDQWTSGTLEVGFAL